MCDGLGRPVRLHQTAGQVSDFKGAELPSTPGELFFKLFLFRVQGVDVFRIILLRARQIALHLLQSVSKSRSGGFVMCGHDFLPYVRSQALSCAPAPGRIHLV